MISRNACCHLVQQYFALLFDIHTHTHRTIFLSAVSYWCDTDTCLLQWGSHVMDVWEQNAYRRSFM